jgi:hypothetical protein
MFPDGCIDVHQHLWPAALFEALRARSAAPMLRGWTLYTIGEAPYDIRPADHDVALRTAGKSGRAAVLLSLSTPLGIEAMHPDDAQPLLTAWHDGVRDLPAPFHGWAAVTEREPDLDGLTDLLKNGFVGLQVSATALSDPAALERLAPALRRCEELDRPALVHPGPVAPVDGTPPWWPAVVQYPSQLQAAWWAWKTAGPALLPELRICFVAGAGLAPLHHERFAARGGGRSTVDPHVFVDTSSYGRQAIDILSRALGIDPIVLGSDRPYAEPVDPQLGEAALRAIAVTNPRRLLEGVTA